MKPFFHHLLAGLLIASAVGVAGYFAFRPVAARAALILTHVDKLITDFDATVIDAKASLDDNYWDLKATIETVATTAKDSDNLVHDLRAASVGGKDTQGVSREGILVEVTGLLGDSRKLVTSLKGDVDDLSDAAVQSTLQLNSALIRISRLVNTLDEQVKVGGPALQATVTQATQALVDLDKLLADPDIQKILAESAKTSEHLAGSAETLDIVMRPWRKKANQIKMVLMKALGMVKLVYAF